MLSRVAAFTAPRTHNRRRVTGSSGRRMEGRESEPQRPTMSRRVFHSAVLLPLLIVMWMCSNNCGAVSAQEREANDGSKFFRFPLKDSSGRSASGVVKLPQGIDLFVSQTTQVVPKSGGASVTEGNLFTSPSLVSAGRVMAAFAESHMPPDPARGTPNKPISDVVAGYIDTAWDWSTLVGEVNNSKWRAHTVLSAAEGEERLGVVLRPTTATKGNRVFLLAGRSDEFFLGNEWKQKNLDLKLVVGDVTNPTAGSKPSGWITWGTPKSLSPNNSANSENKLAKVLPSGGSGVVMEDGTLVFSLLSKMQAGDDYSMIIYSTDNGNNWVFPEGVPPANCTEPRTTEWGASLLMIVDCDNGQKVYESRDKGKTWEEAVGKLLGVWVNSGSRHPRDLSLYVGALITATVEGRKVMLYTQKSFLSTREENEWVTAFYLWVTDNNRSFSVGPVAAGTAVNWEACQHPGVLGW
ncbi:trans-sialidase, putative [Trypanosoma cruzi marinkellei]|uniref:Trans-sialidase, putative n=1 Tax=Trypanosoma cruzi marinkellei TaxID=85056 RepID=K2NM65_TRYCR|nr:trans-sialidase, putative [Trypanosoma cruzi marinkellei]